MSAIAWAIWCAALLWVSEQPRSEKESEVAAILFLAGTGMLIWKTVAP